VIAAKIATNLCPSGCMGFTKVESIDTDICYSA